MTNVSPVHLINEKSTGLSTRNYKLRLSDLEISIGRLAATHGHLVTNGSEKAGPDTFGVTHKSRLNSSIGDPSEMERSFSAILGFGRWDGSSGALEVRVCNVDASRPCPQGDFPEMGTGHAVRRRGRSVERGPATMEQCFRSLSLREIEIMSLVVSGLMNKQVAGRLGIAEITVKIHRGNVMRKMRAQSFADLVRMAECLQIRDPSITRFGT